MNACASAGQAAGSLRTRVSCINAAARAAQPLFARFRAVARRQDRGKCAPTSRLRCLPSSGPAAGSSSASGSDDSGNSGVTVGGASTAAEAGSAAGWAPLTLAYLGDTVWEVRRTAG